MKYVITRRGTRSATSLSHIFMSTKCVLCFDKYVEKATTFRRRKNITSYYRWNGRIHIHRSWILKILIRCEGDFGRWRLSIIELLIPEATEGKCNHYKEQTPRNTFFCFVKIVDGNISFADITINSRRVIVFETEYLVGNREIYSCR